MSQKTYTVWHDRGWPQSRINQMLGGWSPSRFPEDYVHVANVQANGLREAVELTTDRGNLLAHLAGDGEYQPWSENKGVQPLVVSSRDTDQGDVVVDPQGQAYRIKQAGFEVVGPPSPETYRRYERTAEDKEKSAMTLAKIIDAAERARAERLCAERASARKEQDREIER